MGLQETNWRSSALLSLSEKKGELRALMGVNEYGNGVVATWDRNGYRQ